ncbi:MAG: RtcB family protein [Acidobacteria bacterium]|nr:RtcB family protein [Acidobacteriota bacterium]
MTDTAPSYRTLTQGGAPINLFTEDVDPKAVDQLREVSKLPIIAGPVAAMPDVHVGIGATIGSVIPTRGALVPAAVGVDIGCGMTAARLSLTAAQLPDNLRPLRDAIENAVPVGRAGHQKPVASAEYLKRLEHRLGRTLERHPGIRKMIRDPETKARNQAGSLGGGNHFLEICVDDDDPQIVWIMLHSGSRGIGNVVGRYFTRLAKEDMERLDSRLPVGRDLHYLQEGSTHFEDYVDALDWAQAYALENRRLLLKLTVEAVSAHLPPFTLVDDVVECHHNYVATETHYGQEVYVTRKGAIRARAGDRGIVPGSMGARSYIVRGKGFAPSLDSCPHGAGRRMSRSRAKALYTATDLEEQTRGVECRKDQNVVDEIPAAYKDIDKVMADARDLVEIEHRLKQVVCVKG